MLPSEYLQYFFFTLLYRLSYFVGIEYMLPSYHISGRTLFFCAGIVSGLVAQGFTLLTKDRMQMLQCSTITALVLQGIVKFFVFLANTRILFDQVAYLQRVYQQCDHHWFEAMQLNAWAKMSKKGVVGFLIVVVSTVAGFCALPLYLYARNGRMELLLPLIMPGLDENTTSGFIGLTMCHIVFTMMTSVGIAAGDSSIFLFIVQICPLSNILIQKLQLLNESLQVTEVDMRPVHVQRRHRAFLHNIVQMHVEFVEYVGSISDVFYEVFMVEILFDGIGMCLIIFVQMQEVWFPLYMFWIAYFFKTFFVCALGTMTDIFVSII